MFTLCTSKAGFPLKNYLLHSSNLIEVEISCEIKQYKMVIFSLFSEMSLIGNQP